MSISHPMATGRNNCATCREAVCWRTVWNLNLILSNDPDFAGFAFNDLAGRIQSHQAALGQAGGKQLLA